jgi:hypothetical protein
VLAGAVLIVLAGAFLALRVRPWSAQPDQLVLPDRVAGLSRDSSGATEGTAERLAARLSRAVPLRSASGAVYADETGRPRSVIFAGGTGAIASAEEQLDKALRLATEREGAVDGVHSLPTAPPGTVMKCGTIDTSASPMAVCGWADQGSLGVAFFPNRSVAESGQLLREMRDAMRLRRYRVTSTRTRSSTTRRGTGRILQAEGLALHATPQMGHT